MTKSTFNGIAAFFSVILISLFIAGCSGDSDGSKGGYSEAAKQEAIDQCKQSGAPEETCICVTKEIQDRITYKEMQQIEEDMKAGKALPEKYTKATIEAGMACAPK